METPPRRAHPLARSASPGAIPPQGRPSRSRPRSASSTMAAALDLRSRSSVELPSLTPGRTSTARRVPVGVVGVITPWNFPYVLAMRSLGPRARARQRRRAEAGRQHARDRRRRDRARCSRRPGCRRACCTCSRAAAEVGQALVEDPNVRMISFTGSTATGRLVGETAGRMLKRTLLELGGNSPLVVLEDADIEAASSAGAWGSFLHQGQICLAVSRHLVHESIVDDYTEALAERAGAPARSATRPPTRSRSGRSSTRSSSRACGGSSTRASSRARRCSSAARTTGCSSPRRCSATSRRTMPAFAEEIFGPVAPVISFRDDAEAVELANATEYGLAAAVQSGLGRSARPRSPTSSGRGWSTSTTRR